MEVKLTQDLAVILDPTAQQCLGKFYTYHFDLVLAMLVETTQSSPHDLYYGCNMQLLELGCMEM